MSASKLLKALALSPKKAVEWELRQEKRANDYYMHKEGHPLNKRQRDKYSNLQEKYRHRD